MVCHSFLAIFLNVLVIIHKCFENRNERYLSTPECSENLLLCKAVIRFSDSVGWMVFNQHFNGLIIFRDLRKRNGKIFYFYLTMLFQKAKLGDITPTEDYSQEKSDTKSAKVQGFIRYLSKTADFEGK